MYIDTFIYMSCVFELACELSVMNFSNRICYWSYISLNYSFQNKLGFLCHTYDDDVQEAREDAEQYVQQEMTYC
jgi:hypothetical protein